MKTLKKTLFGLLVLTAVIAAPAFAQDTPGQCAAPSRAITADADMITIIETANEIARQLPSRGRVAAIEDAADRLFMSNVLDHVAAAQRIDQMTVLEREMFSDQVLGTAAAAQTGISTCQAVDFDTRELESPAKVQAAECSCVQQCYREWQQNMRECNGSYWCEVGATLLFELCLADCLIPG